MFMSYLPDQMLRNLAPQRLTQAEQRKVDEQLGTAVAVVTRGTSRVTRRVHAWARQSAAPRQATGSFRKMTG
jgi:Trp operon repressor